MADISMCDNPDCKDKNSCYRATAPRNPWRQSYIVIRGVVDEQSPNGSCELDKNSCQYYRCDTRTEEELKRAKQWQEEAEAEYLLKNPNEIPN